MPAKTELVGWTAYCDECDWESEACESESMAAHHAEQHNIDYANDHDEETE